MKMRKKNDSGAYIHVHVRHLTLCSLSFTRVEGGREGGGGRERERERERESERERWYTPIPSRNRWLFDIPKGT
jgi:hypothetical protein